MSSILHNSFVAGQPCSGRSGNVFADLQIPHPDQYLAKAELAAQILKVFRRRGLTQAAAGKLLGITQPKVSALLIGRLDGFSSDRLFRFLSVLGWDVRIRAFFTELYQLWWPGLSLRSVGFGVDPGLRRLSPGHHIPTRVLQQTE